MPVPTAPPRPPRLVMRLFTEHDVAAQAVVTNLFRPFDSFLFYSPTKPHGSQGRPTRPPTGAPTYTPPTEPMRGGPP